MSVFSEMDLDTKYEGDPFAEDDELLNTAELEAKTTPSVVTAAPESPEPPASPAPAAPAGKATEDEGEEAKRKAHKEAEAKRKAEFEARQAEKKAAEQEQLAKLEAMSVEELLTASMKRVSADTEKLTRRNMKECVAEYIQTMCIEDPAFARKVMHPRKSMIRCFQYISRKAWDYVQDELKANGIKPGPERQGYGCDVPDDLCYQWAVDYFNDPDVKEDHEEEEKFVPRPYVGGTAAKGKSSKTAKGKTGDKKPDTSKKTPANASPKKPAEPSGQLSLGGFTMPEEKAG